MLGSAAGGSADPTGQAISIGARANSLLAQPGYGGRVTAVLSDVAYLSGTNSEILWLFRPGVPRHGRGIQSPHPLKRLRSGQAFGVEGGFFCIGKGFAIDLGRAAEWTPTRPGQGGTAPLAGVRVAARRLLRTLSPRRAADGPGRETRSLASLLEGPNAETLPPGSWQRPVISPIFDLMLHCLKEGLSDIETRGRGLIGLGPGLTPSGDDFLGGLFFAAHWIQETYPGERCSDEQAVFNLIQWAMNRTHPISHALLGDLAVGEGPEPLHHLLGALFRGEDQGDRVTDAVGDLLKVGHGTGSCILAGVLTCLLSGDEAK